VYEGIRCRLTNPGAGVTDCVKAYTLVDLTAGYRVPGARRVTVQGTVTNLFDDEYRSFPGVPVIGRLALLRLRVDL
jgi:outer membrane receptor protein involved in Fe transport